jgi:hypothetical protein
MKIPAAEHALVLVKQIGLVAKLSTIQSNKDNNFWRGLACMYKVAT